jgi:DUF4097 and DUF4098 domain-containing protein YvlB
MKPNTINMHKQILFLLFTAGTLTLAPAEVREEFHQTYKLAPAGEVRLDNINGSVRISAWDRSEVKVDAVKRAKKQEHLDVVKIEIESADDSIQIKTRYPNGRNNNNSTSVDYTLTVPKGSNLAKISTVNGGVEIKGVQGDVEANSVNGQVAGTGLLGKTQLSTVNGSVKATCSAVRQPITLKSVNGSLTIVMPDGINADVSADSLNGGISSDFGLKVQRNFPISQKLDGKIGDGGGPRIKLSTVNGSIHIERSGSAAAENE